MKDALREAVAKAGGVRALARRLGIAHPAIIQWRQVPSLRVLPIEAITGVSRYRLRPDVFGPEPER